MSGTSSSFFVELLRLGLVSDDELAAASVDDDDDGVSDDWRAVASTAAESSVLGGSLWISGGVEVKSTLTSGLKHTDSTELVDERETDSPFTSSEVGRLAIAVPAVADEGETADGGWLLLSWSASWTY